MKKMLFLSALTLALSSQAMAQTTLENCAIQEVLPGKHMTGAFVSFHHKGETVNIVSAEAPSITPHVELHSMEMKDNVMSMTPLTNAELKEGVRHFKKGADHVMLMNIPEGNNPKIGEKHTLKFNFSDGTSASCEAEVKSVEAVIKEAKALGGAHDKHAHHKHHKHGKDKHHSSHDSM